MMNKQVAILFFMLIVSAGWEIQAQTDWMEVVKANWSVEEIAKANTALGSNELLDEEKKLVLFTNLARMNGPRFYSFVAEPYLQAGGSNTSYSESLKMDLKTSPVLQPLVPNISLCKSSAYHAADMGRTGKVGHNSSDGTDCFKRIKRYYSGGFMAENCSYGYEGALDILMQLMIDEGLPSLGHRKNILGKSYKQIGVAIRPHKGYRFNCVMDFSD